MSNIIPFQYGEHAIRVQVDNEGHPWWIAKDVCATLGLTNPSEVVARLSPSESTILSFSEDGMPHRLLLINEPGLYRLIFRSNKPEAKHFQDWVFVTVLPQIRKTGQFSLSQSTHPKVRDPAIQMLIDMAMQLDEARALAAEAKHVATIAETKADLALEDAHRMTLEEFVLKNGLLRQFPRSHFAAYSRWLKDFCLENGLHVPKVPVYGQSWTDENGYPLAALAAWLRHEQRKPQQVRLLHPSS